MQRNAAFLLLLLGVLATVFADPAFIVQGDLQNRLLVPLVLKSMNLAPGAQWIQKPVASIPAQSETTDAWSVSSLTGTSQGTVVYTLANFNTLSVAMSWYHPANGSPTYNTTVSPSPWIGGNIGVKVVDNTAVFRAYVTQMCADGEECEGVLITQ